MVTGINIIKNKELDYKFGHQDQYIKEHLNQIKQMELED